MDAALKLHERTTAATVQDPRIRSDDLRAKAQRDDRVGVVLDVYGGVGLGALLVCQQRARCLGHQCGSVSRSCRGLRGSR